MTRMHTHPISGTVPILLSLTLVVVLAFASPMANGPTVDLGYAKYTGIVDESTNITQFLGIRYAAPPTGTLRWRYPQAPAPIPGVLVANAPPPACYSSVAGSSPMSPFRNGTFQTGQTPVSGSQGQSEDCLFLNVLTPTIEPKKPLPVLVWIHGGGYVTGAAQDGSHLVQESGGRIVFVAIQYRLGVFGFLAGKALKQGGNLNAGLLDQHFALRWVKENIGKFGGDSERITIAGTSAGAGSVIQQIIAQAGNTDPSLFRSAVTSSSFLPSQYNYDDDIPETIYKELLSQTGCTSSLDSLECLRSTDTKVLQNANFNIAKSGFYRTFMFVPVVDGTFIKERPTIALAGHNLNGNALLSVTTSHEGNFFVNQSTNNIRFFIEQLFPKLGQIDIDAAVAQYAELGSAADQANAIMSEAIFICPTYYLQKAFFGRSFKSEFAVPPALHAATEFYYFLQTGLQPYGNKTFVDAVVQPVTDFVLALDPNIKSDPTNITPHWDRWNGKTEMLYNRTEDGMPVIKEITTSSALLERCEFWRSVSATTGQ